MSMRSFFRDTSKINYIVNARYKYLQDHYETEEHRASVDGHVLGSYANQYYDLGYIVDYSKTNSFTSTLGMPINDSIPANSRINTVAGLNPAVDLHGEKWKVLVDSDFPSPLLRIPGSIISPSYVLKMVPFFENL